MGSPALGCLIAAERARRLFAVGLVLIFFTCVWMGAAARAARYFKAECAIEVVEHRYGSTCVARRITPNGWQPTFLSFDDCRVPTAPAAVGAPFPCYAFANDPREVSLTPPEVAVATAARLASLALGIALSIAALAVRVRASRWGGADARGDDLGGPFRIAARKADDARGALAIALRARTGLLGWLAACAAAVVGLSLTGIALQKMWTASGELQELLQPVLVLGSAALGLSLVSAWGRSGLVVDPQRAVITQWWGLGGLKVHRHHALSAVAGVRTVIVPRFLMESEERLELRLDGATRVFRCADVSRAYRELCALFER